MLSKTYQQKIKKMIAPILAGTKSGVFIFGTAARAGKFGDVDLALVGRVGAGKIRQIREVLEGSTLPYFFDVVYLPKCSKSFKENILKNKIIWLIKP